MAYSTDESLEMSCKWCRSGVKSIADMARHLKEFHGISEEPLKKGDIHYGFYETELDQEIAENIVYESYSKEYDPSGEPDIISKDDQKLLDYFNSIEGKEAYGEREEYEELKKADISGLTDEELTGYFERIDELRISLGEAYVNEPITDEPKDIFTWISQTLGLKPRKQVFYGPKEIPDNRPKEKPHLCSPSEIYDHESGKCIPKYMAPWKLRNESYAREQNPLGDIGMWATGDPDPNKEHIDWQDMFSDPVIENPSPAKDESTIGFYCPYCHTQYINTDWNYIYNHAESWHGMREDKARKFADDFTSEPFQGEANIPSGQSWYDVHNDRIEQGLKGDYGGALGMDSMLGMNYNQWGYNEQQCPNCGSTGWNLGEGGYDYKCTNCGTNYNDDWKPSGNQPSIKDKDDYDVIKTDPQIQRGSFGFGYGGVPDLIPDAAKNDPRSFYESYAKEKSNPKMGNLGRIADIYHDMERIVDPDMTGDLNTGYGQSMISDMAQKYNLSEYQIQEIWDSGGTTDIDVSNEEYSSTYESDGLSDLSDWNPKTLKDKILGPSLLPGADWVTKKILGEQYSNENEKDDSEHERIYGLIEGSEMPETPEDIDRWAVSWNADNALVWKIWEDNFGMFEGDEEIKEKKPFKPTYLYYKQYPLGRRANVKSHFGKEVSIRTLRDAENWYGQVRVKQGYPKWNELNIINKQRAITDYLRTTVFRESYSKEGFYERNAWECSHDDIDDKSGRGDYQCKICGASQSEMNAYADMKGDAMAGKLDKFENYSRWSDVEKEGYDYIKDQYDFSKESYAKEFIEIEEWWTNISNSRRFELLEKHGYSQSNNFYEDWRFEDLPDILQSALSLDYEGNESYSNEQTGAGGAGGAGGNGAGATTGNGGEPAPTNGNGEPEEEEPSRRRAFFGYGRYRNCPKGQVYRDGKCVEEAEEGESNLKGNTAEYSVSYYRPDVGGDDDTQITGWNELKSFSKRVGGISRVINVYRNGKELETTSDDLKRLQQEANEGGRGSGKRGHSGWMKSLEEAGDYKECPHCKVMTEQYGGKCQLCGKKV